MTGRTWQGKIAVLHALRALFNAAPESIAKSTDSEKPRAALLCACKLPKIVNAAYRCAALQTAAAFVAKTQDESLFSEVVALSCDNLAIVRAFFFFWETLKKRFQSETKSVLPSSDEEDEKTNSKDAEKVLEMLQEASCDVLKTVAPSMRFSGTLFASNSNYSLSFYRQTKEPIARDFPPLFSAEQLLEISSECCARADDLCATIEVENAFAILKMFSF